jgi:flagellar assembly protein FliH
VSPLEFTAIDAEAEVFESESAREPQTDGDERATQIRVMIDAARNEAAIEARTQCEHEFEMHTFAERERVNLLFVEAERDRKRFLAEAETQLVRLALAVARKILAREAAADPMHLTAIVKAALTRIHDSSGSTLRVNPAQLGAWTSLLSQTETDLQVIADEQLEDGSVTLETRIGHVELGIRAQMEEVERCMEDLMQRCANE